MFRQSLFRNALFRGTSGDGAISYGLTAQDGVVIKFYNALSDAYIAETRYDASNNITGLQFEITRQGSGNGTLILGDVPASVAIGVRADIFVGWTLWYSGRVTTIEEPSIGVKTLGLVGLVEDLNRVVVTGDYSGKKIEYNVDDINKDAETATSIVYDAGQIEVTGWTMGDVEYDHDTAKKAIENLYKVAGTFEFGCHANRKFYFLESPSTELLTLFENYHCTAIEVVTDGSNICNKVWVEYDQANLFDNGAITEDKKVDNTDGSIDSSTYNNASDNIAIIAGQAYTISGCDNTTVRQYA